MVFQSFTKYMIACGVVMASSAIADDAVPAPTQAAPVKKVPTKEELFSQEYIQRLSVTYGHMIQKSLNNPMIQLNAKSVMQGIQEGMDGKKAPLTEKEYEEALQAIQQYAYEDMANKNLTEAEAMLKKNASEDGVVVLEEGKLQYKVMTPGSGDVVVSEENMPTINYEATYSNGQKLGSSEQSGGPIDVKLNDTIPGFKKGMMGMKVGEKRRILIHPDLGFGKSGQLPNGLLVFEVEVTKISPLPANDMSDDEMDDDEDDDFDDSEDDEDDEDDDLADADDFDDDDDNSSPTDDLNFNKS